MSENEVKDKKEVKKEVKKAISTIDLEQLIMGGSTDLRKVSIPYEDNVNIELYIKPLSALDLTKINELSYQEILKYASLNCVYKDNEIKPENKLTEFDLSNIKSGVIQSIYLKIDEISNITATVDQSDLKNG